MKLKPARAGYTLRREHARSLGAAVAIGSRALGHGEMRPRWALFCLGPSQFLPPRYPFQNIHSVSSYRLSHVIRSAC
eukprot:6199685-Pleurochrysis_carterae.AAC.2